MLRVSVRNVYTLVELPWIPWLLPGQLHRGLIKKMHVPYGPVLIFDFVSCYCVVSPYDGSRQGIGVRVCGCRCKFDSGIMTSERQSCRIFLVLEH